MVEQLSRKEVKKKYETTLLKDINKCYDIARKARKKGYDPVDDVEVVLSSNIGERVVGIVSVVAPEIKGVGIEKRIKELEKEYGILDWRVAFKIAEEIAQEKFCKFESKLRAVETGVRVGFAYMTLGVVSSPLEGFLHIELRDRMDKRGKYFAVYYAGPIRNAGGTMAAVSVLITDYLRKKLGYDVYDATEDEINRAIREIYDYHERITNLQYLPSEEEIRFLMKHLPVQIEAVASEDLEVSNFKDLPRVSTNKLRNGFCLVIAECLSLKAPKLWKNLSKWADDFDMGQWKFLKEFVDLQKEVRAKKAKKETKSGEDQEKIKPDFNYIKDIVSGRPVLSHPSAWGGLRLRYGRTRTTGYSAQAIHPATMHLLKGAIAFGTQLKVERPGKAAAITVCDSIEGPIVRLTDGTVKQVESVEEAKRLANHVEKIIYLGDVLVNYGDFFDRGHILAPAGYCEEWWIQELKNAIKKKLGKFDLEAISELLKEDKNILNELFNNFFYFRPSPHLAIKLSKVFEVPMHPRYTPFWKAITPKDLASLIKFLQKAKLSFDSNNQVEKIVLPYDTELKSILEKLAIFHIIASNEFIVIDKSYSIVLPYLLGFDTKDLDSLLSYVLDNLDKPILDLVNEISSIKQRDRAGTFIGARMGRPEKAKVRKMTGSPNSLFPVGQEGGRLRSFEAALSTYGYVKADFKIYYCYNCDREVVFSVCEYCGAKAKAVKYCNKCGYVEDCEHKPISYKTKEVDIRYLYDYSKKLLGLTDYELPEFVKGVRGTNNEEHYVEHLAKGILRAKHGLPVNKDGTIRYDASEIPLTHFKPKEIGVSVSRLIELGYTHDIYGKPLENDDQILELFPQDIVLPCSPTNPNEPADEILFRVANFIDDLLVRFYGLEPFYNLKNKEDLVGHLVVALAPHTSAGTVCRIIGFSKTQGLLAHPSLHASIRRDADGDEAAIILLLDVLLNFSTKFLPASRGGKMDAPLVLMPIILPKEVDDMYFNVDTAFSYPLEFYEATLQYKNPWDVKIPRVEDFLDKSDEEFISIGFTHPTSNLNAGPGCSSYKILPTMEEKLELQMELARKIEAVDENHVAKLIIEKHFLRDIKGNLRKFTLQQFRCVNCNEKYRRPPLVGKCLKCGGRIIFTISEGSIKKYLNYSLDLAKTYDVGPYLIESLEILKDRIDNIFGKEIEMQGTLNMFFKKKSEV